MGGRSALRLLQLAALATLPFAALAAQEQLKHLSGVWVPHASCDRRNAACDSNRQCHGAGTTTVQWDACPAGTAELRREAIIDSQSCALSSSCTSERACPAPLAYAGCVQGDCWSPKLFFVPNTDCSASGRAYIKCCGARPRVTCAALLPCTWQPAAAEPARRATLESSTAACLSQGLLGGLLASNLTDNPVFQAVLRLVPALGGVARALPAVATWYAHRWDGAIRPLLGGVLCSGGAGSTDGSPSTEAVSRGLDVARLLVLPVAKAALRTTAGSVVADSIQEQLGFDTSTIDTFISAGKLREGLTAARKAVRASKDPGSVLDRGLNAGRVAAVKRADIFDGDKYYARWRRFDANGDGYLDNQERMDFWMTRTRLGELDDGLAAVLVGLLHLAGDALALDSRITIGGLVDDAITILTVMADTALNSTAAAGQGSFAQSVFAMSAGERAAFLSMRDSLRQLLPAADNLIFAIESYPDPPDPALFFLSPASNASTLPSAPATQLPPAATAAVTECSARDPPLFRAVTAPLASRTLFTAVLGPMPSMGRMMRMLAPVASWYAARWDVFVRPLMKVAICSKEGTNPANGYLSAALTALRSVVLPVVRRFLTTNTGLVLNNVLRLQYGFDTSTLETYLTTANARDLVRRMQRVRPSNERDYDYSSVLDLDAQQLIDALTFVRELVSHDPRFTVQDMVLDVLVALQYAAQVPLQGPGQDAAAGRRRLLQAVDPILEALFAMSPQDRAAFQAFVASVAEVRLSVSSSLAALDINPGPALPGTTPRDTPPPPPPPQPPSPPPTPPPSPQPSPPPSPQSEANKGLSTGAIVGIVVGSVVGVLLAVLVVVLLVRKRSGSGGQVHAAVHATPMGAQDTAGVAPQPAVPQLLAPQLSAPQPAAPQPAEPQPAEPQPAPPQPAQPQPAEPQPTPPQPAAPQPVPPQPAAPQHEPPQHEPPQPATEAK